MTLENMIRDQILFWLSAQGIFAWITDRTGTYDPVRKRFRTNKNKFRIRGVADISGILPGGRALFIEVKTKTGKLSAHQKLFLVTAMRHGAVAFVARSVNDAAARVLPLIEGRKQ